MSGFHEHIDPEMRENARAAGVDKLAERAGVDPSKCEFCGKPLDDSRPWVRGLDGAGAHDDCVGVLADDGDA